MSDLGTTDVPTPRSMLAELTHRCPLKCPYCSNPLELDRRSAELSTDEWKRVFSEAADLGVYHVHLSGGEPTARTDITELLAHARSAGLYSNLITSGVLMNEGRLDSLIAAGLDHLQLSLQDVDVEISDRIGGLPGGHARKLDLCAQMKERRIGFTLNFVVHRQNITRIGEMLDLALEAGADRAEIAHTQYYGWALRNRSALMPTRDQLEAATKVVMQARERLKGKLVIDYVVPDYYARFPKPCMGGWAQTGFNVTPTGKVLPCHAAETIADLEFDNVRQKSLDEIWRNGAAFSAFRGTEWMEEPCRSCERKEQDWGGCRCQAFHFTGRATATDPACSKSPLNDQIQSIAAQDASGTEDSFAYRGYGK